MSLDAAMVPRGESVRRKLLGNALEQWAWATLLELPRFTRIPCFAYSIARLREIALIPPLVIIGNRRGERRERMIGDGRRDTHDAAVGLLRQHLLDDQLRDVDEAVQGCGRTKRESPQSNSPRNGFGKKYAGIVHQSIDRAEFAQELS